MRQLSRVLPLFQRAGDAAHPQQHALAHPLIDFAAHHHVGDGDAPTRLEHAKRLPQHPALVGGKIDHAVRNHHVHRVIGQGDILDLALEKLDVCHPGLSLIFAGQGQHVVGHVEPIGLARRPNALGGKQHIDAAARAKVQHRFPRLQFNQRRWIAAP